MGTENKPCYTNDRWDRSKTGKEKDMLDHFRDTQKMQEILREAQTGLWVIELDDGQKPRMYADSAMLELQRRSMLKRVSPEYYQYRHAQAGV